MNKFAALALVALLCSSAVAFAEDNAAPASKTEWWSKTESGWVGGIGGSIIGLWGALVGCSTAFASTRKFTLPMAVFGLFLGIVLVVVGLVALVQGQPYHVYYGMLLGGTISVLVFGMNIRPIRRRMQALELQKMSAQDVGG